MYFMFYHHEIIPIFFIEMAKDVIVYVKILLIRVKCFLSSTIYLLQNLVSYVSRKHILSVAPVGEWFMWKKRISEGHPTRHVDIPTISNAFITAQPVEPHHLFRSCKSCVMAAQVVRWRWKTKCLGRIHAMEFTNTWNLISNVSSKVSN